MKFTITLVNQDEKQNQIASEAVRKRNKRLEDDAISQQLGRARHRAMLGLIRVIVKVAITVMRRSIWPLSGRRQKVSKRSDLEFEAMVGRPFHANCVCGFNRHNIIPD
jgi:hypothetical protein